MKKIALRFAGLAGAAAIVGLTLGAGTASASVQPAVRVAANGTAGYYVSTDGTHALGGTFTGTQALLNVGAPGVGGTGLQMCDPNSGQTDQVGIVAVGNFVQVMYQLGVLSKCVGAGVLQNPKVVSFNLTGLNPTDSISLYENEKVFRVPNVWCSTNTSNPCRRHKINAQLNVFWGFDNSISSDVFYREAWNLTNLQWNGFTSVGAGIQQDLVGMSACTTPYGHGVPVVQGNTPPYVGVGPTGYSPVPDGVAGSGACNLVASATRVSVNGPGIFSPGFFGLNAQGFDGEGPTVQVATTGGGLSGNAAIVAPNNTISGGIGPSNLGLFAGQVLG